MKQRVVWVHGIGTHMPGYSKLEGWQSTLQEYWQSSDDQFAEVNWDVAMADAEGRTRGLEAMPDPAEEAEAEALRIELERTIAQRQAALAADPNRPEEPAGAAEDGDERLERGIFSNTVNFFNASVGDFVRYLTNSRLRTAVKDEFKQVVEPLLAAGDSIAVVSHSWGTIVSYEALYDLSKTHPGKRVAALFTLGSPLWMLPIRPLIRPAPSKPANVDRWINITAHGDPIGGWLYPHFPLDRDFQAPGVKGISTHSSYFTRGNAGVMQDLVSRFLTV